MNKRLWLNPKYAQGLLANKQSADALALAIMVKSMYSDSVMRNASIRNVMKVFHISYKRCVEALKTGNDNNILVWDGVTLKANKIRCEKGNDIALSLPISRNKDNCEITITQVLDKVRCAVLYNHISMQNDLRDTVRLAFNPQKGELKQMKSARRKLMKRGVQGNQKQIEDGLRLSYNAISGLLNISRTKTKQLVKYLCKSNAVKRIMQFEETELTLAQFSKQVQMQYSKYGKRGFMVINTGMVCLQLANIYEPLIDGLIKLHF